MEPLGNLRLPENPAAILRCPSREEHFGISLINDGRSLYCSTTLPEGIRIAQALHVITPALHKYIGTLDGKRPMCSQLWRHEIPGIER